MSKLMMTAVVALAAGALGMNHGTAAASDAQAAPCCCGEVCNCEECGCCANCKDGECTDCTDCTCEGCECCSGGCCDKE
jgi:hypothetical protein